MNLTKKGEAFIRIAIAAAIFSICTITFGSFPYLGLSISLIALSLSAYYIKGDKTPLTKTLLTITLLLSAFLVIRSEEFLTFLNLIGIFAFGSLMLFPRDEDDFKSISSLPLVPPLIFLRSLFTRSEYYFETKTTLSNEDRMQKTINMVVAVVVTTLALLIIIPLLASTNPFFNDLILSVLDALGLRSIKITESLFEWSIRFVVFSLLLWFLPKVATTISQKINSPTLMSMRFNLSIPKTAVASVLLVFFVTQLQFYFASSEVLNNLGYTYSQHTREVFAQLSAVAAIVLVLIYNDKGSKKINKTTTLILLLQGVFLTFMAYKSVYEYSSVWGLTYKRLYGFTIATWILGVFGLYLHTYRKGLEDKVLIKNAVVFTGIMLILVNIANFDYLIYHFRKSTTERGIDHEYLSRLSPDSLSYKDQLAEIAASKTVEYTSPDGLIYYQKASPWQIIYKINGLQTKYQNLDIREFNLLEYVQYLQIKDIDTKDYQQKYPAFFPPDF